MIAYCDYAHCDAREILPLYEAVGWVNYTARPELLERAYAGSLAVIAAFDEKRLVGIIRAVGDGASIVFVQDLLVHPEYQNQGIGSALMNRLLARYKDTYQLELMTDDTEKTTRFYESVGFKAADTIGCRAFIRM